MKQQSSHSNPSSGADQQAHSQHQGRSTLKPWQKLCIYGSPFLLFLGIAWFLLQGLYKDPQHLPSARVGKPLPSFELGNLLKPEQMLTEADFTGEPALLNVWATWCPSCRVEHGELNRLASEEKIRIYGLNYKDDPEAARQYLKALGDPYYLSVMDIEGRLGFDLGVYGAPETYVVDASGVVHHRFVGVVDQAKWENELKPILDKLRE